MWFALSGRFMGESCRVKYLFTFELSANTKQRFMSGRVLVSLIQNSAMGYIYFPTQTILLTKGDILKINSQSLEAMGEQIWAGYTLKNTLLTNILSKYTLLTNTPFEHTL